MTKPGPLRIRVNDELVLDAGTCYEVAGPRGPEWLVRAPAVSLFHQVLGYLREKADPTKLPSGSVSGREGVAAAAVSLRWGSYLAVLLDEEKPGWPGAQNTSASRIDDDEMARINIEASAALAEWIDISRSDPAIYMPLVNRAVHYLPMRKKTSKLKFTEFAALADRKLAASIIQMSDVARVESISQHAVRAPTRVFANALVNVAWRNGPVESIHAGTVSGHPPLDYRRMTSGEERMLMAQMTERLALGMAVCRHLAAERPGRPWHEQVLPYGLAEILSITPSGWTLTETSRDVRLPR